MATVREDASGLLPAVFDALPDAAFLASWPDRRILATNAAFDARFGPGREGEPSIRLAVDPAAHESAIAQHGAALGRGESVRFTLPFRGRDGRVRSFACDLAPARVREGRMDVVFVLLRDRSPLEEAERRLRVLAEAAGDVVIEADADGVVAYVSPSVRDVLGYEPDEVLGKRGDAFVLAEDLRRLLETGSSLSGETYRFRARRKDGAIRWMEAVTHPLLDGAGAPAGRVSAARDVTARVEADEALRASEARWRSLVEDAADYIATIDREGRILYLNRDAPGRPRREIVGRSFADWSPPEDRARFEAARREVFDMGRPVTFTTRSRAASGQLRAYETRLSPVWTRGEVTGAIVVSRDLTERARLEEELAQSQAKMRHLAEAGFLGVAVGNNDGAIIEANDAFLAAIGHSRATLDAGELRWDKITPPESAARDREAIRELLERGSTTPYEKEYIRADGTRAHVLVGSAILSRERGESIAFALDVSAQRAAEARLRSEQRLAETILAAQSELGEGIAVVDASGRLLHANDAMARLTGHTLAEMFALPNAVAAVTAPEAAPIWAERFARIARGEPVATRFDSHIKRKDGASLPVEIVSTSVDYQGQPCRLYILRDLTGPRAAQRQLEAARAALAQAEKLAALGTLVSGVAHEARTPMTAMVNASHVIHSRIARGQADRSLEPLVATILENAERLNGFIEELRRFTRMGSVERVPLSLDAPTQEALRLFGQTHAGIETVERALAPTPLVNANHARLVQVVINLVDNAVDATGGKGRVRVATGGDADARAWLLVEDDGPGIDDETKRRMFDPLFTTKPHGTGLGLAIVQRIAEEHGASIDVDSAPGKGTRIRLSFPAVPRA